MRAFARLWDTITRERYGIADPARRRFRYGVQVNSLGLTEAQPENNVQRIVLEMLAVTLSRDARARAVQLPAWNEALGLPRPWDQQWSLRIQQVLAYESDLLEYCDLFDGSIVVEDKTAELVAGAEAEMAEVAELGGMVPAVESGYLKARLVAAHAARRARIESGQDQVVGVNCFQATEPSPLTADADTAVHNVDPAYELAVLADLAEWWPPPPPAAGGGPHGPGRAEAARNSSGPSLPVFCLVRERCSTPRATSSSFPMTSVMASRASRATDCGRSSRVTATSTWSRPSTAWSRKASASTICASSWATRWAGC